MDRIVDAIYGEVVPSAAVTVLLREPIPTRELPASPPGTPHTPAPREGRVTRYLRHVRAGWATELPFPNPLQAVVLAAMIGLTFVLGDPLRTSAPVYAALREYGGVSTWGTAYLAVTVVLLIAWRWLRHGLFLAYLLAASGYLLLAVALAKPAWEQATVSWLATIVFAWLSWVHAQAAGRVSHEWRIEVWLRSKLRRRRE